jgi:hypothetical protein
MHKVAEAPTVALVGFVLPAAGFAEICHGGELSEERAAWEADGEAAASVQLQAAIILVS